MTSLERKAEMLNALMRRRLELEAQLRMVGPGTSSASIRTCKRQLVMVNNRIARLESRLR